MPLLQQRVRCVPSRQGVLLVHAQRSVPNLHWQVVVQVQQAHLRKLMLHLYAGIASIVSSASCVSRSCTPCAVLPAVKPRRTCQERAQAWKAAGRAAPGKRAWPLLPAHASMKLNSGTASHKAATRQALEDARETHDLHTSATHLLTNNGLLIPAHMRSRSGSATQHATGGQSDAFTWHRCLVST